MRRDSEYQDRFRTFVPRLALLALRCYRHHTTKSAETALTYGSTARPHVVSAGDLPADAFETLVALRRGTVVGEMHVAGWRGEPIRLTGLPNEPLDFELRNSRKEGVARGSSVLGADEAYHGTLRPDGER